MAETLTLQTFQEELDWDGNLVDVYVLETDLKDWQALVEFLGGTGLSLTYLVDDEPAVMPEELASIFAVREEASPLLTVDPGGLALCCHFFTPDEIELTLDPRGVTDAWVNRLTSFLTGLTHAVGKPVLLCRPNQFDQPSFIFTAQGVTRS